MQVAIFTHTDDERLEKTVNKWLNQNKHLKIIKILQTESFSEVWSLTITMVYEGEAESGDDE